MRLHFNKIGYKIYGKEQSRRVPSHRAKPGNPGYGFRLARWRDTLHNEEDRVHCETLLRSVGCDEDHIRRIRTVVQEYRYRWGEVRRPSRPAGPGRPRRVNSEADGLDKLAERAATSAALTTLDASRCGKRGPGSEACCDSFQRAVDESSWLRVNSRTTDAANKRLRCDIRSTNPQTMMTLQSHGSASSLAASLWAQPAACRQSNNGVTGEDREKLLLPPLKFSGVPSQAAAELTTFDILRRLQGVSSPQQGVALSGGLSASRFNSSNHLPALVQDMGSPYDSAGQASTRMSRSNSAETLHDLTSQQPVGPSALRVLAQLVCTSAV